MWWRYLKEKLSAARNGHFSVEGQERAAMHEYDEFIARFGDQARQLAKSWNRSIQRRRRDLQIVEEDREAEARHHASIER